jgi:hypothetical protein
MRLAYVDVPWTRAVHPHPTPWAGPMFPAPRRVRRKRTARPAGPGGRRDPEPAPPGRSSVVRGAGCQGAGFLLSGGRVLLPEGAGFSRVGGPGARASGAGVLAGEGPGFPPDNTNAPLAPRRLIRRSGPTVRSGRSRRRCHSAGTDPLRRRCFLCFLSHSPWPLAVTGPPFGTVAMNLEPLKAANSGS